MKSRREPPQASNVWSCPNCPGDPTFEHADMMKHMADVHKLTDRKGKRQMVLHLDAADHHTTAFEWTIGGLKFQQTVICPRETVQERRKRLGLV